MQIKTMKNLGAWDRNTMGRLLVDELTKKYEGFFFPNEFTLKDVAINLVGIMNDNKEGCMDMVADIIHDIPVCMRSLVIACLTSYQISREHTRKEYSNIAHCIQVLAISTAEDCNLI